MIRRATAQDAGRLAADRAALFAEADPTVTPAQSAQVRADTRAALEAGIPDGRLVGWLADDADGRPVGSAVTCLVQRLPTPTNRSGRESFVAQMYIVPEARGRGTGRRLLETIADHARREDLAVIRLRATEAGRPLYLDFGFATLPDFMQLTLTGAPDAP